MYTLWLIEWVFTYALKWTCHVTIFSLRNIVTISNFDQRSVYLLFLSGVQCEREWQNLWL